MVGLPDGCDRPVNQGQVLPPASFACSKERPDAGSEIGPCRQDVEDQRDENRGGEHQLEGHVLTPIRHS